MLFIIRPHVISSKVKFTKKRKNQIKINKLFFLNDAKNKAFLHSSGNTSFKNSNGTLSLLSSCTPFLLHKLLYT